MTGIICAMAIEADGIKNMMSDIEKTTVAKIEFTNGKIHGKDVVVAECGIGKVNAAMSTQIMIDLYKPQSIVNSGVAGSLSEKLSVGDIVISDKVLEHDMDITALGDPLGQISFNDEQLIYIPSDKDVTNRLLSACKKLENTTVLTGAIASGDKFISDVEERLKIGKTFEAMACEMEGASVGQVCYRNGVPFSILRSISDDLKSNEGTDYMEFCKSAAEKSIAVIEEYISNI